MSDFELIKPAAKRAANELLAGWPVDEVPYKWINDLDLQSTGARCRQLGIPWMEVENIQATAEQAAVYASKQTAKGFIRFAIKVPHRTGDSVMTTIMTNLNKRFVGKAVGNIYFLTSIPRLADKEAEYFSEFFDINYEYI